MEAQAANKNQANPLSLPVVCSIIILPSLCCFYYSAASYKAKRSTTRERETQWHWCHIELSLSLLLSAVVREKNYGGMCSISCSARSRAVNVVLNTILYRARCSEREFKQQAASSKSSKAKHHIACFIHLQGLCSCFFPFFEAFFSHSKPRAAQMREEFRPRGRKRREKSLKRRGGF
jgi:hypothetical protein